MNVFIFNAALSSQMIIYRPAISIYRITEFGKVGKPRPLALPAILWFATFVLKALRCLRGRPSRAPPTTGEEELLRLRWLRGLKLPQLVVGHLCANLLAE